MSVLAKNNVHLTGNQESDKTLVFAHGFGTDQSAWHELVKAFADEYRIVLFDYVGANEQTVPFFNPRKYKHLTPFADDLLDILETLELRQVTFIGHSAGGMTGVLAAIQEPGWFSRLVLLNSAPSYVTDAEYVGGFTQEDLVTLFGQMEQNYHAWISGFAPMVMGNPDRPYLAHSFTKTLAAMRPDVALALAKVIFHADHRKDIPLLPHPTLVLQARQDVAVPPAVGYYMEHHMPNAILSFLETEGHLPHISDPDQVIRAIRPFLN